MRTKKRRRRSRAHPPFGYTTDSPRWSGGLLPALLNVAEVAIELGVTRPAIYYLIRSGDLSAVRVAGALRVRREAFQHFVLAHRTRFPAKRKPAR